MKSPPSRSCATFARSAADRALLRVAEEEDLRNAREAAALITSRKFHRDKDLLAELELFVRLAGKLRRDRGR